MTRKPTARIAAIAVAASLLVPIAAVAAPPKAAPKAAPATPVLLSMKQVTISVDPAGDETANAARIAAFQSATLGIFSCADVAGVAQGVGATVESNERLPFASLPPSLQATIRTMKVGTATQLFGNRQAGKVSVLVLCARR